MKVRTDKFFPPQVDTPSFLFRERVVGDLARRCGPRKPLLLVEAQAGQGKSTLIKQYLDSSGVASAWFQVGQEDTDPAFFLLAIQACLAQILPVCSRGGGGLTGGAIVPADLPRRIDLLLEALEGCLRGDFYLVFDDLHNLAGSEVSLFILDYLVEHAPGRLHFALSSREPLPLGFWRPGPEGRGRVFLRNRDLALDENEVADFFHHVLGLSPPQDSIERIFSSTDGWVMGVLLLGLQMSQRSGVPALAPGLWDGDMVAYFRRTVFAMLEPRLHAPLMALSLLEEIPVELARELTGEPDIGAELARLATRNAFVRPLDRGQTIFGLHHLFRQFLRERARTSMSEEEAGRVKRRAGLFFAGRDNPAQALRYLLAAGDHEAMEEVLRGSGMTMLAANQTATLAEVLGAVPEEDLARLGWAGFYLALAHLDFAPARALPLLKASLDVFAARRDEQGELLCLAHIISIHITTTGHYREGEQLLERAEELFARLADSLGPRTTIMLGSSLATGRCIFLADTATATRYANMALSLARKEKLPNFEASLLMVMGYIQIFAGRMSLARQWLEQASEAAGRPEVGSFNRLAIRMMLFNFLFHDGEFDNYFDQKNRLVADLGRTLFSQSIAGPFCMVWEMDIAINQGRLEHALDLAALALAEPLSPHLRSQVLQLQAVVLALTGQSEPALEAAEESARLRERSGGLYFVALNRIVTGLAKGLCGLTDQALELLGQGIEGARAMPTAYLEACGLMHRGAINLRAGRRKQAREDIEAGLGLMRRNAYRHFWAWTPRLMRETLGFAVSQALAPACARALAWERAGTALAEDGAAVELLEFKVLGGFTILHRGAPLLPAESLTPAQRELLCLLLAAPGLKLSQDTVQLHFWPDSSPPAARTKFDTMLSRLRKTLSGALSATPVDSYLNRDRGILWLANCRVDALDFLTAAAKGMEHLRLQEFWQAGNAFAKAEGLWRGEFAPGITGDDRVRALRDSLSAALARTALSWSGRLAAADRQQAALELAEKALNADPLNDALWALLYRLHGRRSTIRARQVLERFASLMRAEDYPEGEIAEMLASIRSQRWREPGGSPSLLP